MSAELSLCSVPDCHRFAKENRMCLVHANLKNTYLLPYLLEHGQGYHKVDQVQFTENGALICLVQECWQEAVESKPFCEAHNNAGLFVMSHTENDMEEEETSSKLCEKHGCERQASGKNGYCSDHQTGRKLCKLEDCSKRAKSGGLCIAHGGGELMQCC